MVSSHANRCIGSSWAVWGEVGLAGEIRPVGQPERRIAECSRLGFTDVLLPKSNLRGIAAPEGIRLHGADTLLEALYLLGLTAR